MKAKAIILALAFCLLSACGGGSDTSILGPNPSPSPPPVQVQTAAYFSLTRGNTWTYINTASGKQIEIRIEEFPPDFFGCVQTPVEVFLGNILFIGASLPDNVLLFVERDDAGNLVIFGRTRQLNFTETTDYFRGVVQGKEFPHLLSSIITDGEVFSGTFRYFFDDPALSSCIADDTNSDSHLWSATYSLENITVTAFSGQAIKVVFREDDIVVGTWFFAEDIGIVKMIFPAGSPFQNSSGLELQFFTLILIP